MPIERRLDPDLAPAFEAMGLAQRPLFDLSDVAAARAVMAQVAQAGREAASSVKGVVVAEHAVPGAGRGEALAVRVTHPLGAADPLPALLWFHGGGMVLGCAADDDPLAARLAATLGCVVVAVDYALAPEHPYPAALDDGIAAYRWLLAQAADLGVRGDAIGIGGFSAGGGLAAAVALRARDEGLPRALFLSMTAPMLDDREKTPTDDELPLLGVWDAAADRAAWRAYLGRGEASAARYAAPARVADLAGLPPAFVAIGEIDLFRDEAIAFATRLVDQGVPTELHLYPGCCHGFDGLNPDAAIVRAHQAAWQGYLARMFARAATV